MSSVDDRVVAMRFDNAAFERGVKTTLSSLDALKSKLNFGNVSKALTGINLDPSRFHLPTLGSAIDGVSNKFLAFATVGVTAISNVTNKAVDAGLQLAKSLTIDPIKAGFDEYELKMGSIQTILANTAKYGTKLEDVTGALDELNNYADKTIYNFGDMTKNIGLFTNAGIRVEDATSIIKGFSNEAAASGVSAQGAASAAYQLSQAFSAGKITLMDFRSLQNVGLGNANMKDGITDIAQAMGTLEGKGVSVTDIQKDFNGTLEKGWLTADVMSNYLKIMAGDMTKAEQASLGLSDAQINAFSKQQKTAEDAATKVRTLTSLMGTLKESVGSGFAESFGLIFGDFDQATKSFSRANATLSGLAGAASDARNKMLQVWQDDGGRKALIKSIMNIYHIITSIVGPIHDAFRDIFPATTGQQLADLTRSIAHFTNGLILSKENGENLRRTFAGLFAVIHIIGTVIFNVIKYFATFIGLVAGGGGGVLAFTGSLGDLLVAIDAFLTKGDFIGKFFDAIIAARAALLGPIIAVIGQVLRAFGFLITEGPVAFVEQLGKLPQMAAAVFGAVGDAIGRAVNGLGFVFGKILGYLGIPQASIDKLGSRISSVFDNAKTKIIEFLGVFGPFGDAIAGLFDNFNADSIGVAFSAIGDKLQPVIDFVGVALPAAFNFAVSVITPIIAFIGDAIGNMFAAAPAAIDGLLASFASLGAAIGGLFGGGDSGGGAGLTTQIQGVSDSLDPALSTMEKIKNSLQALGEFLKPYVQQVGDIFKGLGEALLGGLVMIVKGIAAVFYGIFAALSFGASTASKIPGGVFSTIADGIGYAVNEIINFVKGLSFEEIVALINTAFFIMFYRAMNKFFRSITTLFDAGAGALDEIGGTFNQLTGNLKTMQADVRANMILKIAVAIGALALSLFILSKIPREDLVKGLIVVGLLLKMLMVTLATIEKGTTTKGAVKMQIVAGALGILAASLILMSGAVAIFGTMDVGTIKKGLGAIALILGAITLMSVAMSKFGGAGSILVVSVAIGILAISLVAFAGAIELYAALDPSKMLYGGLLIAAAISAIAYTMSMMPKNILSGAFALLVVSVALTILAGALMKFGSMKPAEIATAFIALGGALGILFVAMLAMNALKPAAVTLLVVSAALILLATAMQILGQMTLTEIGIALLALMGALAAIGITMFAIAPVIPVFAGLAGAIALLGLGVLLAGAGVLLLSAGLAGLAITGAAGFAVLIAGIIGFLAVLPLIAQQFGLAIIATIVVIGASAGAIFKAAGLLVSAFLRSLTKLLPDVGNFLIKLIAEILRVLVASIPAIAGAGIDIMIGLLNALRDRIPDVAKAAGQAIVAFVKGIGDNLGDVIDQGFKTIIKFLSGIEKAIRENGQQIIDAGVGIADALVDGAVQGIRDAASNFTGIVGDLADAAIQALKDKFHIPGGPSKVMLDLAKHNVGGGLIKGIEASGSGVNSAAGAMAKGAIDTVAKTMSNLATLVDAGVNTDPVIRPVLDLTQITQDASKISGMLDVPPMFAEASIGLAGNVSAEQQASADAAALAADAATNQPARDVKFEQTINAPTALTATEIYRDTRNLISLAKEALNQ